MSFSRTFTNSLVAGLTQAGIQVVSFELNDAACDADLIRFKDDMYLSVDYEDYQLNGLVSVSLNENMVTGGNPTYAFWNMPPTTQKLSLLQSSSTCLQNRGKVGWI